jgi:putative redox protein
MTKFADNAAVSTAAGWVVARSDRHGYRTEIVVGDHHLVADEPATAGGVDAGPSPYELLLAALASCTAMTMRMYADRKQWPLHGATVSVRTASSHATDCAECDAKLVGIKRLEHRIVLDGPLSEEQRGRLLEIAERCPVRQTLLRGIPVDALA